METDQWGVSDTGRNGILTKMASVPSMASTEQVPKMENSRLIPNNARQEHIGPSLWMLLRVLPQ